MQQINPKDFTVKINDLWLNRWFLLTSGDFEKGHYNTMTVAWGWFGAMWNKAVAGIVVRPTRFTFEFTEQYKTFTLCSFPQKYRQALSLLGTTSGRDSDKITTSGLTACPAAKVNAPVFREADLIIECRKIYWDDFKPENFLDSSIEKNYPAKDYHRLYLGEIQDIRAADSFITSL